MHPVERLRYVVRASGVDPEVLVSESASALAAFTHDGAGLVTACRRLVSRQPTCGPIWWLAGRMLCGTDPIAEARDSVREITEDRTSAELSHVLPEGGMVAVVGWPDLGAPALARRGDIEVLVVEHDGQGGQLVHQLMMRDVAAVDVMASGTGAAARSADLVIVEALMMGPDSFIAQQGSLALAATAKQLGTPVWLTAGVGRIAPARVFDHAAERIASDDPWDDPHEIVPLSLIDQVAGPTGLQTVAEALATTAVPIAPELFVQL